MKLHNIIYILLLTAVFSACTKEPASLLDAPDYTYSDGEFTLVKWGGYRWAVLPQKDDTESYAFEVMLLDSEQCDLSKIYEALKSELGEPFMTSTTLPHDLIPNCMNSTVFLLPGNRYAEDGEMAYWWEARDKTVRLYTADEVKSVGIPAIAVLSIYDMDVLMEVCNKLENE